MSVEGMWALLSGEIAHGEMYAGGIVVMESERIFGGDSMVAYVGTYHVEGANLTAKIERWKYNANLDGVDVFGDNLNLMPNVTCEGIREEVNGETVIRGHIWRDTLPHVRLPVIMKKMRDLP